MGKPHQAENMCISVYSLTLRFYTLNFTRQYNPVSFLHYSSPKKTVMSHRRHLFAFFSFSCLDLDNWKAIVKVAAERLLFFTSQKNVASTNFWELNLVI